MFTLHTYLFSWHQQCITHSTSHQSRVSWLDTLRKWWTIDSTVESWLMVLEHLT